MQETLLALRRTNGSNGEVSPRLVDGVEHGLAKRSSLTQSVTARAVDAKPGAGPPATALFLDDLRLTRDCLTEIIQDHCPDMHILGLRPADYSPEALSANVAIIIFNLNGAIIKEAAGLLRVETKDAVSPPVLFISDRVRRSEAMEAVECGAMGLVPSDARIDLLIAAIRLVVAGGSYFPADTLTSLMAQTPAAKNHP